MHTINTLKNIGFNITRKFIIFQFVIFFSLLSHNAHADVLKSNHNNVRVVEVETSHKLSDDQIHSLKELFKNKYQSDIEIDQIVNSELIAGIKVKVNDEVIDLSLQNRFNQIKQQLII